MTARTTSIKALHELQASGKGGIQRARILRALLQRKDMTRREIQRATGIDINAVCGRVRELIDVGAARETEARRCRVTGKTAAPVQAL